jgi:hypothetical protein
VAKMGEKKNACMFLVRIPEGRQRCRWKDDFKMDLKRWWKTVDLIQLTFLFHRKKCFG